MLSPQNRMRSGSDFTVAVRRGRRAGRQSLVVHYLTPSMQVQPARDAGPGAPGPVVTSGSTAPLVGFVVPKSVGNAVARNRVERRLRHLMRDRIGSLPDGSRLVVRAQPSSARTPALMADLDSALSGVLRSRSDRSDRSPRSDRVGSPSTAVQQQDETSSGSLS